MKLLILGGTIFLGRHLVEAAQRRGHEITLFNRGRHNADLFPAVEKLRGDRSTDLSALEGRRWDAVIDTCGYIPRIVRRSAELLAGNVDHYTFVSSLSVYADFSQPGIDERAPVGRLDDPTVEEVTGETYGPLKALCEEAAEAAMPSRVFNVRPGLIVGPHDPTDRFTYWPVRVADGGDILAPSRPDYPTEIIDVRDLAAWIVHMAEKRNAGVYNATGHALTLGSILETSRYVSGSDAQIHWADEAFLLEKGVQPWQEMPLWVGDDPSMAGFAYFNIDKAVADGLTFCPLDVTVRDTLAWAATRPADHQWRAGISRQREAELLKEWTIFD
ncbi:MAG: NAD-dependent epimerase/dehydratase family protein [Caldilineaceae bacterium]|nr:NAD-dependent epimerase/dehydratase family protein [Caldilineaceae bacterium]